MADPAAGLAENDDAGNVTELFPADDRRELRMIEAILFASRDPVPLQDIAARLPEDADVERLLNDLGTAYAGRGITLRHIDGRYAFRTADDLAYLLRDEVEETRRLSRAALETLAIIAYHQPVTRAEIEDIRGVSTSRGTLDVLLETGWIRLRGRKKTPGRPVTFGTAPDFLDHFGLETIKDLPGLAELKDAGLLDAVIPAGLQAPDPDDTDTLREDEDPLEDGDLLDAEGSPGELAGPGQLDAELPENDGSGEDFTQEPGRPEPT